MSTFVLIACTGLLLIVLLFVAQPLLRSKQAGLRTASTNRRWLQLAADRDAAYGAIQELDFDRDVLGGQCDGQYGRVSSEDYGDQHAALEESALAILRELDQLSSGDATAVEARVRRDLMAITNAGPLPVATTEDAAACPSCGGDHLADHRFCPHCGGRLEVAE